MSLDTLIKEIEATTESISPHYVKHNVLPYLLELKKWQSKGLFVKIGESAFSSVKSCKANYPDDCHGKECPIYDGDGPCENLWICQQILEKED
jgi:hypothetical protein